MAMGVTFTMAREHVTSSNFVNNILKLEATS